jgi:hypothetical protein
LGLPVELAVVIASRPDIPPEEELRTAVVADRLGWDLWVGEGFVWDAIALATAAGLATERIALTVGPIPVSVQDSRAWSGWRPFRTSSGCGPRKNSTSSNTLAGPTCWAR